MPQHICQDCVEELISSYNFRIKCQASESELQTIVDSTEQTKELSIALDKSDEIENIIPVYNSPLPCLRCFKYYLNQNDLIEHTNHEHEGVENINVCCYCSKEYNDFKILRKHTENYHLDEYLKECGYCTFQCNDSVEIENHLLKNHFESKFHLLFIYLSYSVLPI